MSKRARSKPKQTFTKVAQWCATQAGRARAFTFALLLIVAWLVTGPMFGFSDTWQLVINTGTTIITFLMVFLIQNSQNRDTRAIQIKLDELLRATHGAHVALLDLEDLSDEELEKIRCDYEVLAKTARKHLCEGGKDTDSPEVHCGRIKLKR